MDSQSAYVHACKIRRSDSQCFIFGQHVNERLLSRLAGLRRKTASYPGSMSLEKVPTRSTRSTASMISLERSTHTLSPLQPPHPTRSSGMQVKAMAWKPGDDCTVRTTPRRPYDAWRSFSKFRTHRDASESRIQDLRWRTGSLRNVNTRCSLTVTDDRPCQASDDSLVAAMFRLMQKNLEETVKFTNEDEGFQKLFDRLLAYSSTKQSVKMSENMRQTRRDDPMDVDALSKGKSKRKSKKSNVGSGKGNKGQNQMTTPVTAERSGQETKEAARAKEAKERKAKARAKAKAS